MAKNCYHCGQAIPSAELVLKPIQNQTQSFCCQGCASVCEAIHEAGLENFYQRTPNGELLAPPPVPTADIELYDYDEVQAQFVEKLDEVREITLMSSAIHCAACVWLIEHRLAKISAIQLARVNFTNKQIKIRWDNRQIQLSDIIRQLNEIGYDASPYDSSASEEANRKANRDLLYRLGFAGFAMMNAMWFSIALYTGAADDGEYREYFHWLQFVIATVTLAYSGQPFIKGAIQSLKAKSVGMDFSITLGIFTTYFYSIWVMTHPEHVGEVYFETMIDFMFLLLIGRYFEAISKNKAVDASRRLMDLQPKIARKKGKDDSQVVPIKALVKGDEILIKPGEQVAVDGFIVAGQGMINEAMLSGESKEVNKNIGDSVIAGTLNIDGHLTVRVDKILHETQLGKIVHMVEEAQGSKAPIQRTTDKIMPWFVSVTVALALGSFAYWFLNAGIEMAVITATAVLIITCPCAFGLATPMSIAVASGVSARNGILIKEGAVLENLSDIEHFVFDKTGTLTKGKMALVGEYFVEPTQRASLLKIVGSIESLSEHSLAAAIVGSIAEEFRLSTPDWHHVEQFKGHAGKGVSAVVEKTQYHIGTRAWCETLNIKIPAELVSLANEKAALGQTAVWMSANCSVQGVLFLEDEVREDAAELIKRLKQKGKQVTLLSGDLTVVANSVAKQLGGMNVIAEVLPEDKNNVIADIQSRGQTVAMVGDGVNDAPALVRADVGIALGSGTDVSVESADIVLMNNQILAVDTAIALSVRTLKTIKQNIASSIAYNIIMVPLAVSGALTPLIAAITMPISSLVVIGNAARIRTFFKR